MNISDVYFTLDNLKYNISSMFQAFSYYVQLDPLFAEALKN